MKDPFIIRVWFTGPNPRELKCQCEYESNQVMQIRVFGARSSILVWTDYPLHYHGKSSKGSQWKIREGELKFGKSTNLQRAILLRNIFSALQAHIKAYLDKKKRDELPFQ